MTDYMLVIEPLPEEEGGGFMAYFPDLPGCMSDGDSPAEAVANAMDALGVWLETQKERAIDVPAPGSARDAATGQFEAMRERIEALEEELKAAQDEIERLKSKRRSETWARRAWPPSVVVPAPPRKEPIAS